MDSNRGATPHEPTHEGLLLRAGQRDERQGPHPRRHDVQQRREQVQGQGTPRDEHRPGTPGQGGLQRGQQAGPLGVSLEGLLVLGERLGQDRSGEGRTFLGQATAPPAEEQSRCATAAGKGR